MSFSCNSLIDLTFSCTQEMGYYLGRQLLFNTQSCSDLTMSSCEMAYFQVNRGTMLAQTDVLEKVIEKLVAARKIG